MLLNIYQHFDNYYTIIFPFVKGKCQKVLTPERNGQPSRQALKRCLPSSRASRNVVNSWLELFLAVSS